MGPSESDADREAEGWLDAKERGGVFAIRFTVFLTTVFGRRFMRFKIRIYVRPFVDRNP